MIPSLEEFINNELPKKREFFYKENPDGVEWEFIESLIEAYTDRKLERLEEIGHRKFDVEKSKYNRIIEYLDKQLQFAKSSSINESNVDFNTESKPNVFLKYTHGQKALIFKYIFSYFNMKGRDFTDTARLIHLVTGDEIEKIKDSAIYQKVRDVISEKISHKQLVKDLSKIKILFDTYQFKEICEKIEIDILEYEKKINRNF